MIPSGLIGQLQQGLADFLTLQSRTKQQAGEAVIEVSVAELVDAVGRESRGQQDAPMWISTLLAQNLAWHYD